MTAGVLVYIFRGAHVLLAQRKTGLSIDKWNGLGGQVVFGENSIKAASRTVHEGAGITPLVSGPLGEVLYHHPVHGNWKVTIFRADSFMGDPQETNELSPKWWPVDAIPYDQMWSGDDQWLPYVVDNTPFIAELWFDANDKLKKKDIQLRQI